MATLAAWALALPTLAATYYVAPPPTGSDTNAGSRAAPWATPAKAVSVARGGDTVYFRGGNYPISSRVEPQTSGSSSAWITFAGYPAEEAVIDGTPYTPAINQHDNGLINVVGPSYLRFIRIGVSNSHGMGFTVRGPSHHVELHECVADNTFGPGIGLWNCSQVKVLVCEVTRANNNALRLYGNPADEAPHEAISSGGATYFEIASNHVHDCYKELIDIKEVSANGSVHHNYVHHGPRQGLYADAWFGVLHDVEFHHNIVHNCEWGIGISSEGSQASITSLNIHHNLFYNNRGSGVYFTLWGGNGPRSGVVLANNTFYFNGSPTHWSGPTGSIDLRSTNIYNLTIVNNICSRGGAFEIATFDDPADGLDRLAAQQILISHNLTEVFKDNTHYPFPAGYNTNYAILGESPITNTVGFTYPSRCSFYLGANSRARGAGINDPRFLDPGGSPADLGAFAYELGFAPDLPTTMELVLDNVRRLVQPTVPGRNYRRQQTAAIGLTWTNAPANAAGSYVPDIYYFVPDNPALFYRCQVTDLAR